MLHLVVAVLLVADPLPEAGAEARIVQCGPGSAAPKLRAFRLEPTDAGVVMNEFQGSVSTSPEPSPNPSKPKPGCPGLPRPTDWDLRLVASMPVPRGSKQLLCTPATVGASRGATALALKPGKGCPEGNAFSLTGGVRESVRVLNCKLKWKGETLSLTFGVDAGVERIWSEDDCFSGGDHRVTEEAGAVRR